MEFHHISSGRRIKVNTYKNMIYGLESQMAFQTQMGRKLFLPVLNSQCTAHRAAFLVCQLVHSILLCMHVLSPYKNCKLFQTGTGLAVQRVCTEGEQAECIGLEVPRTLCRILGNSCTFFQPQASLFKVTNHRAWHHQLEFFKDFMIFDSA